MIIVTGGSGELAQAIGIELAKRNVAFRLFGRKSEAKKELQVPTEIVENYDLLSIDFTVDTLLITNGFFLFKSFEELSKEQLDILVEANFTSAVSIIWRFLKDSNASKQRDVFVIGSTAAYDLSAGASVYGASKLGIKGLLQSLNREYTRTNTRFSLISLSTVDNSMGRLVPDQDPDTLLNLQEIASEVCDQITRKRNYFEPEVLLRRRFIQDHKK